jgi:hypothetical protein
MTQQNTVSPFISRIEDVYQLNTDLSNAGYQSVFDVIRVPRKQFIKKHKREFGKYSESVYDLANGFATQIRRKFRKSELSTSVPFNGANNARLQGLQKNGPTWLGLFDDNWASYCLSSSPEANDSPVSYLSWLYKQALDYETDMDTAPIIKLATRRPDLATLWLDDDAINQVIPSLQLVNEILEDVIQTDIASDSTVDQTLAITRYPNLLPYHYPHEQTTLALDNCDESLLGVISQVDTAWPYFIQPSLALGNSENALEVGSNLAPEQQIILTEVDNAKSSDLTDFYKDNFGITATDYNALVELAVFAQATGLPVPQVEQLLSSNKGGSLAIQSLNYLPTATPPATPIAVNPSVYGSVFVNDGLAPAISIVGAQSIEHDGGKNTNPSQYSPLLFPDQTTAPSTNPPAIKEGLFGQSLALYNVAKSYAYVDAASNAAAAMNGDAHDFTLGFWVKFSDLPGDFSIPLFANSEISGTSGTFYSTLQTDGTLYLLCQDTAGLYTGILSTDKLSTDTWYYIAFTWTLATKSATLYYGTRKTDLEKLHIDFTKDGSGKTTGSMATVKNYTWVFNDAGNFSYYGSQHSIPKNVVETQYDDIIIVWRCLSEDDVVAIISSGLPADGSLYEHYYPLNSTQENSSLVNLDDTRMDRINRMVRLQRWLELPYDQVDLLLTANAFYTSPDEGSSPQPFRLTGRLNSSVHDDVESSVDYDLGGAVILDPAQGQWGIIKDDFAVQDGSLKDFTLGFWVKVDANSSGNRVLATNGSSTYNTLVDGFTLYYVDGTFQIYINDSGVYTDAIYTTDTWYHIACKLDTTTATLLIYDPTSSDGLNTLSIPNVTLQTHSQGQWVFNNDNTFAFDKTNPSCYGAVSYNQIAIWNRALTDDELTNYVESPDKASDLSDHDMLHYYPFDDFDSAATDSLRTLGVYRHFKEKYNLDAYDFTALINQITPYAITPNVPYFDQVFNSPSLFETPFTITNGYFSYTDATDPNARIVKQICAGLQISEAQFLILAKLIDNSDTTDAGKLHCSLDIVSRFYRLVMLPRWLGLSFTDGLSLLSIIGDGSALKTLAAAPIISALDDSGLPAPGDILSILMAASDAADWLRQHGLSASKTYALLQDGSKVNIATNAEVNFINDINQQIPASLLTEAMFENCGVPNFAKDGTPIIWTDTLKSLVDSYGLVIDTAVTLADITKAVTTAITGIIFADLWTQPEIADILANLIYQTQVSQSGIATSALAKALGVDHSLPAFLLPWAGSSTYDLLNQSWALSPTILGTAITTETIPANYLQLLYQVARRSAIVKEFALTPAMLSLYLANPTWFGVPDTGISLPMFYAFSRYCDWLKLTPKEDAVLAYLSWVNSATATTKATVASAATALAALLDWDASEVTLATAHANPTTQIAVTLAHVDTVMRLQTLSDKTGVSAASLIDAGALTPATEPASTASAYADWQPVGESFIAAQAG